nr:hypothetical protein [Streptomyces sp. or3]
MADKDDGALFDAWETAHPATADDGEGGADLDSGRREAASMNVLEAIGKMPYDFSPARLRCRDLAEELSDRDSPGAQCCDREPSPRWELRSG